MLIALLSGCTPDAPTNAANQVVNATSFAEKMTGGNQAEPVAEPFSVTDKSEELEFAYSYPAEAAAIPELVRRFDREIRQSKASALKLAKEDQASAKKSGYPFHGHALETHWTVEGNIPAFLSLLSTGYSFTGGAHGMTGYDALIWDRAAKRALGMAAMLSSPADFKAAINDDFCAALDKERAARRACGSDRPGRRIFPVHRPDGAGAGADIARRKAVRCGEGGDRPLCRRTLCRRQL